MKRSLAIAVALMAAVGLTGQPTQSVEPHTKFLIGMWKQNMDKSVYSPGGPPPKGSYSVRQYAAGEGGAIVAVTMNVGPDGFPSLGAISAANYDGKEYAQHTLATLAMSLSSHVGPGIERTISYRPIDSYTVEIVQKENGKVVTKSTRGITRDGKTMTERFDFTNAQGQHFGNVLVFEKQ